MVEEPERQIPAADAGDDQRRRLGAGSAHAARRAPEPGVCARRQLLPADQLRICRGFDPPARTGDRRALRCFLLWAISRTGGNSPKYLKAVDFIPLPDFIRALSENQINLIK